MIKKYIAIVIGTFVLLFATVGCTDWLDVLPENELVKEDFWKTESQVEGIVAGCYRSFAESDAMSRMVVYGEVRSDNVVALDMLGGDLYKVLEVDITSENSYASWTPFYSIINNCNLFLHSAEQVVGLDPNFTQSDYNSLKAEVLTLRSLAYFYLVRAFKEVPWVTEPSIADNQNYFIPKSSERAILDSLYVDLAFAEIYAPEEMKISTQKYGVTKRVARSLLADIYMWDEQYDNAIAMCDKVIDDPKLKLESYLTRYWNVYNQGNSSESIFELYFYDKDDEMSNPIISNWYGESDNQLGALGLPYFLGDINSVYCPFTTDIVNASSSLEITDITDYRYWESINVNLFSLWAVGPIFKYAGTSLSKNSSGNFYYSYRTTSSNWIIYRLADIMLLKAEALVARSDEEKDLKDALKIVNTTYLRSNPDLRNDSLLFSNYSSQLQMQQLVLRERQRELLFEGKRWFDLMRLVRRNDSPTEMLRYVSQKFTEDAVTQYSKMSFMDALYFPISKSELKVNTKLVQNPFYSDLSSDTTTVVN